MPTPTYADRDWMVNAACRGTSKPNRWFPEGTPGRAAKDTCKNLCPVRQRCLEYAMAIEQNGGHRNGIWGGLTRRERDALQKQRNAAEQEAA